MMKVADLFAALSIKVDRRSLTAANQFIGAAKSAAKRLTLAGVAASAGFGFLVNSVAKTADELAKLSQKLGITVEGLQQLEFAAQISGTDLGQLRTGLQRFARTASDSTRGLKDAKDAFREVGVTVKDANGELKPMDELLMGVADTFATMPNGTEKTALAMRLFGRSGAELIPFLNEGSAGIAELRKEFVELGGQMSGESAAQFEQFNDDMLRTKVALRGLKQQVVVALLPAIQDMVTSMLAWVKANKDLLKQRLLSFAKALVAVMRLTAKTVAFVIENWKLLAIVLGSAGLANIIMKLVAAMKLLQIATVRAAVAAVASWVLALLPFILLTAAIVAVVLIVEDLWQAFTGGESVFKDLYLAAKTWILDGLTDVMDKASDRFAEFVETLVPGAAGNILKRKRLQIREDKRTSRAARDRINTLNRDADSGLSLEQRIAARQSQREKLEAGGDPRSLEESQRLGVEIKLLRATISQERARQGLPNVPGGGASVEINNTIVTQPGQDNEAIGKAVGAEVNRKMDSMMRQANASAR